MKLSLGPSLILDVVSQSLLQHQILCLCTPRTAASTVPVNDTGSMTHFNFLFVDNRLQDTSTGRLRLEVASSNRQAIDMSPFLIAIITGLSPF